VDHLQAGEAVKNFPWKDVLILLGIVVGGIVLLKLAGSITNFFNPPANPNAGNLGPTTWSGAAGFSTPSNN
jgi:hypothetical protein